MGEINRLRVKSPYELMRVVDIKIENKSGEHGYLYLKCLIDDSINFQSTIKASTDDKICVYEEPEDENKSTSSDEGAVNINIVDERICKILFNGIVQNIKTSNVNEIYYLEIQALTSSIQLDIKEKSRSFQNMNMTYDDLINQILSEYSGYGFTQYTSKGQPIGKPLFQYRETDWNFIKRIASELKSDLYCDIMEMKNMFYFGRPQEHSYTLRDDINYKASKNLKRFHEAGGDAKYHDTDYFYYEVKIRDRLEICSQIYFKQKELYIGEYEAYVDRGEIIYKYKLCRKNGVWQEIIYNKLLRGASLEGEVLAVEGEFLKLHLNIDENQNEGEACWFYYAPPTVNIMYSMPLVGSSARLYFPNEMSEKPIVTGCARKNGDTCEKTDDTTKTYFETEYGSEIEMLPGALNIKSGSQESLSISFDDNVGVTLTSPKRLSLNAGGEIVIRTPNSVNINATSQILMIKGNTSNGVSVESEVNVSSNYTVLDGSDRTGFGKYTDDEPQMAPPPKKQNEGINFAAACKAQQNCLKDQNGNPISFIDACRAATGNTPLYGTVNMNGNSISSSEDSNNSNFDGSVYLSPGNFASIESSKIQTFGDVMGSVLSPEYKGSMSKFSKVGDIGVKASIGLDIGVGLYNDIGTVPNHQVVTNAVVNLAFDWTSLYACAAGGAAVGSIAPGPGTIAGAIGGFVTGLLYIGATQSWTPIKKESGDGYESIEDAVKERLGEVTYQDIVDENQHEANNEQTNMQLPQTSQGMWTDPSNGFGMR